MKAVWKDHVIAESDNTEVVEGNHYFPREDVKTKYLKLSTREYTCPWKGDAEYYHLEIHGDQTQNAAWSYPEPKEAAKNIKGYIAFEPKVEVTE